ncbi:MAG: dephospho-CoA kinase [Verrucomicrobia bacterium]|nr:dephospho-CoA kinase [Verrucomicrobiota bacterium]
MKKIAVTGGLSSGKSTVCQFLIELGAYVISADEIVHNLLSSDSNIRQKVVDLLGSDVLVNNQLNREAIAEKVFSQSTKLKSLESILHPLVLREIELKYQAIKNDPKYTFFVAEIPLLYETETEALFDVVVVVLAKESLCKERFLKKKQNNAKFSERMSRQMPQQEKAAKAHFVLLNNGTLAELKNEVVKFASNCT